MPKQVDHAKRRLVFAAAAFRVIARRGLARVTVREIAKEAGFTTGALVHYFSSKDQVLIQASEYSAIVVRDRMAAHETGRDGLDALSHVLYESLPMTVEMRGMWNVWLGFWDRATHNKQVRDLTEERYQEWLNRIAVLIERAQAVGELSPKIDARRTAQAIVALIDGIGVRVLLTGSAISAKRQRELVDAFIENLPRGAPRTAKQRKLARTQSAIGTA